MQEINAKEVQEKLENGEKLNLIDVRETEEVANGKIPTATNIPLGLLEFRENELDQATDYIMVCRSGGRSGQATQYLESRGFKVKNMTGGMLDWEGNVE
ncbi:rhodanese-like domain-containing protein [Halalkalibacillus halophilus]|uniref:rhodanese-like domain-containing protein n=1 Tax=Halalkalibacillus halophilus TaxID=392827 RepID=UPI000422B51E|nr:rhodanese-like domain-containing protein [Halalkalibacillus halophilus]